MNPKFTTKKLYPINETLPNPPKQNEFFGKGNLRSSFNNTYTVISLIIKRTKTNSSKYFKKMLLSEMKEKHEKRIEVKFSDPANVFPSVVRFMYDGHAEITQETAIPILAMADQFIIPELKQTASIFIKQHTTKNNVLDVLAKSIEYHADDVTSKCIYLIAKNFCFLDQSNFNWMPYEIFLKLISHDHLGVKSESTVYYTICQYIKNHPNINEEEAKILMVSVHYPYLNYEDFEHARQNPYTPKDIIIESLVKRIDILQNNLIPLEDEIKQFQPRPLCGISFDYQSDFDTNGIIFYIGSRSLTNTFSNPARDETIGFHIFTSSIEKGDPLDLTSRSTPQFWTRDIPSSWVIFDFGENRTVTLNYYTLMHGGNYRADTLRNWDIQGSNDKQSWKVLRQHRNDDSLDGKFATCSWRITQNLDKDFRYIRLLQTGYNSTHHNFLVLAGVEFYGELFELN
ncbi:hypothetical protein M0811_01762 [Anaeramoeba ignava]|uniref:BTB domain-containing protein n=1 Tax=Anaeramoeba ignava TaxID=1746090 RepID=A0A9Q0R8J3_ANAIG|nr:hypothetical protein M0811_01762 [Anaeramoeba ignava]